MPARFRLPNLTNALIGCGTIGLFVVLASPDGAADRAARVETRAEEAARALLEVGRAEAPLRFGDPATAARLTVALRAACAALGHPKSYLPESVTPAPPSLADVPCYLFESKHFCFMLTQFANSVAASATESSSAAFLEVYAWPQTLNPPGHSAFYVPEVGDAAFTRNLMHRYVGWNESRKDGRAIPRPGDAVPRKPRSARWYRGRDDERWIV